MSGDAAVGSYATADARASRTSPEIPEEDARSRNFFTLPVVVRARPSTKSTDVGHLKWANRAGTVGIAV
jgi:hypothetical protein